MKIINFIMNINKINLLFIEIIYNNDDNDDNNDNDKILFNNNFTKKFIRL